MAAAGLALPWLQTGCIRNRPLPRLLASRAPLPPQFAVPLPRPPVLRPVRSDDKSDYYEMTARTAKLPILPGLTTEIWGYEGTVPGPTIEARQGRAVSLKLRNELARPIVNHLHGGRTPPESDGYPTDLILPVSGWDVAAHRGMSGMAGDPRARISQGERIHTYPNEQRAATLWYHDHRMDFTAAQVWRGLAGFYILRDEDELKLPLPRGEKEWPLLICDRSFDRDGSLLYPSLDRALLERGGVEPEYMGGVLGDVMLVNGAPWPQLEVANTRYRFRILNACNARQLELALETSGAGPREFVQIGSDGGLLAAPLRHKTIRMAPAERFDVVIDFAGVPKGAAVTLVNRAGTGAMAQILRFVVAREEKDEATVPERLSTLEPADASRATVTRTFDFSYQGMDRQGMERGWTINGKPFDAARMDATPKLGATEIWQMRTDFSHPLHLHLVHFQVLSHSGRPGPYDAGMKDTLNLGAGQTANLLIHFAGYRGRYVFHCHNLEHEDMAMMANFEVV